MGRTMLMLDIAFMINRVTRKTRAEAPRLEARKAHRVVPKCTAALKLAIVLARRETFATH